MRQCLEFFNAQKINGRCKLQVQKKAIGIIGNRLIHRRRYETNNVLSKHGNEIIFSKK